MLRILLVAAVLAVLCSGKRPNILFMLIDDMGWNDIGYNNASDVYSPTIDRVATQESLILTRHYTQHICSPTRAALLTGRYPIHLGVQHDVISPVATYGVPLGVTLLPEILGDAGYDTHLIGKWHMGDCATAYTPTRRGFDTFNGFLLGDGDHWNHTRGYYGLYGYDLRNGTQPVKAIDDYSAYLFGNMTQDIILNNYGESSDNNPFFMELAFQVIHSPLQAPKNGQIPYLNNSALMNDSSRLNKASMVAILDDVFSQLIDTLKSTGLWDNTLLIVASDNGAPVNYAGSNWPLRGAKTTLWEGGVRNIAFVSGGVLPATRRGQSSDALMHVTDWLPTVAEVAGIADLNASGLDGVSQWPAIARASDSARSQLLHNVDPTNCTARDHVCGAIRVNQWKLVVGNEVMSTSVQHSGWVPLNDTSADMQPTVDCKYQIPVFNASSSVCPWNGRGCLYDIIDDPCEINDLSAQYPDIYDQLMDKLIEYNRTQAQPLQFTHANDDDGANPANLDGFWGPWLD